MARFTHPRGFAMTQDEMIKMARDTANHATLASGEISYTFYLEQLEAFAKLVAKKERKWIGLTEVEIIGMTCDCEKITMDCMIDFANAIQDKLKEKNT